MGRDTSTDVTTLSAFLKPRSIAVVGASDDTDKTGGRALDYLDRFGFGGEIYAVNSKRKTVQGRTAYASTADLPSAPDLAIIAVPSDATLDAVIECGKRGVQAAIVTSSGFAELGEQGRALEQELLSTAREFNMRLLGPNSQGVANFSNQTVASFSSLFLTYPPVDGPVAIVSQSGSMSVVPYCQLRDSGIGVRYCIATGNEVDAGVGDFAELVLHDPEIKLVLLYAESIGDPQAWSRAGELARQRDVPMVALKAARSSSGRNAALSHTGAIVNEDRVVSAFLDRHGVYRADDSDDLVRCASLYLKGWRPHGNRLAILTDSGASAVMLADNAEHMGLAVDTFPQATRQRLDAILPSFAATGNPVDMTSVLRAEPELFAKVLEQLRAADVADLFAVAFPASGSGYNVSLLAQCTAQFCANSAKALAVAVPQASIAQHFRDCGLPTFASETQALLALKQLSEHCELIGRHYPAVPTRQFPDLPSTDERLVPEHLALQYLQSCGLRVADFVVCESLADARAAYATLGPQVVLKGLAAGVAHKGALGLVSLDVHSSELLDEHYSRLMNRLAALQLTGYGVMVARRQVFTDEIVIGAKIDPVFGPVVMVGRGGHTVESTNENELLMSPASQLDVERVITKLSTRFGFDGGYDESVAARNALIELIVQVSQLADYHQDVIASLDLNPVVFNGSQILILDALIECREIGALEN